jgi:hypothetical protein
MDFAHVIDSFQEALLIGKPRDAFAFAVQYFRDEKQPSPGDTEEAHALHLLPFLIFNPRDFRAACCTIYCHHINSDAAYKNFLDGPKVLEILSRMNLHLLGLKVAAVDEVGARCTLYAVCCKLYVVRCTLYAVGCMLYVVGCRLYAACCMLYAVRCML